CFIGPQSSSRIASRPSCTPIKFWCSIAVASSSAALTSNCWRSVENTRACANKVCWRYPRSSQYRCETAFLVGRRSAEPRFQVRSPRAFRQLDRVSPYQNLKDAASDRHGETAPQSRFTSREQPFVIPSAVEESLTSWKRNSKRCLDFRSTLQSRRVECTIGTPKSPRKTTLRATVVQTPLQFD